MILLKKTHSLVGLKHAFFAEHLIPFWRARAWTFEMACSDNQSYIWLQFDFCYAKLSSHDGVVEGFGAERFDRQFA